MSAESMIPVLVGADGETFRDDPRFRNIDLDPNYIASEIERISGSLISKMNADDRREDSKLSLSKVTISFVITAEGRISLLGNGVKAGANVGLTVELAR